MRIKAAIQDRDQRIKSLRNVLGKKCEQYVAEREAHEATRAALAVATRLLRRAVAELRGWCSYDDAETREFLEKKP